MVFTHCSICRRTLLAAPMVATRQLLRFGGFHLVSRPRYRSLRRVHILRMFVAFRIPTFEMQFSGLDLSVPLLLAQLEPMT